MWLLLRFASDRWWLATVILFGPRMLLALPLAVLLPATAILWRRSLWPLLASLVLLVGPVMGFCLPFGKLAVDNAPTLRLLTYNVEGDQVDGERLVSLVKQVDAEVVTLQECSGDLKIPWPAGWHVERAGQLIVASRYPLESVTISHRTYPFSPWPAVNGIHATLSTPCGPVGVCCVHLMSPREGLAEVLDRHTVINSARSGHLASQLVIRRLESKTVSNWLRGFEGPLIVAGDFNMPVDSGIFREYWSDRPDAFSAVGLGFGYTKYEPLLAGAYGIRIDHVLTDVGSRAVRCWVGPDIGSDHRPVLADVEVYDLNASARR